MGVKYIVPQKKAYSRKSRKRLGRLCRSYPMPDRSYFIVDFDNRGWEDGFVNRGVVQSSAVVSCRIKPFGMLLGASGLRSPMTQADQVLRMIGPMVHNSRKELSVGSRSKNFARHLRREDKP